MKSPLPVLTAPARSKGRFSRADRELATLSRALGHPARVAILRLLTECGECMCGSIVDRLPLSQATVSQHLKVLKDAGLIQGEVEGPRVCYCVQPAALNQLRALLSDLRKH
jgi:ArsR family transcriptional regulator